MEEVLTHCRELTVMFNGVEMVINEHWNDSSNDDDDAGHYVVQKVQEGSGEVGLILQVTGSGGDGGGLEEVQATAVELEKMVVMGGW